MLILNEKQYDAIKDKADKGAMLNSYSYIMSRDMKNDDGSEISNEHLMFLIPPQENIDALVSGDMRKSQFEKDYKEQLKSREVQFFMYTIARSFNERKYMPIFVCSQDEMELGYMKIFIKMLQKKYGMKKLKLKTYMKAVKAANKEAKKAKKKKREKVMAKALREYVKENCQMSIKGIEYLEKQDAKFAIDRVALLISQSDDAVDEMNKKALFKAIESYASQGKKYAKKIKGVAKNMDLSKKPERWSKADMIQIIMAVYQMDSELED